MRVQMYYHRFNNLAELSNGDLPAKMGQGIYLDYLLHPTAPPISICSSSYYFYVTLDPCLLSWRRTLSTWTFTTPATRWPPPLLYTPHTVCLYLSPFPASVCLPFVALSLHLGPCWPLGVCPPRVPPSHLCYFYLPV